MNHDIQERLRVITSAASEWEGFRDPSEPSLTLASERLEELISRAAEEVPRDASARDLHRAERNYGLVLAAAQVYALERGSLVVDDEAVEYGLRLCPLWPFC